MEIGIPAFVLSDAALVLGKMVSTTTRALTEKCSTTMLNTLSTIAYEEIITALRLGPNPSLSSKLFLQYPVQDFKGWTDVQWYNFLACFPSPTILGNLNLNGLKVFAGEILGVRNTGVLASCVPDRSIDSAHPFNSFLGDKLQFTVEGMIKREKLRRLGKKFYNDPRLPKATFNLPGIEPERALATLIALLQIPTTIENPQKHALMPAIPITDCAASTKERVVIKWMCSDYVDG